MDCDSTDYATQESLEISLYLHGMGRDLCQLHPRCPCMALLGWNHQAEVSQRNLSPHGSVEVEHGRLSLVLLLSMNVYQYSILFLDP